MDKKKSRLRKEESQWDRKKIVFFTVLIIFLLILGFSFKNSILGVSYKLPLSSQKTNSQKQLDVKRNVQNQIRILKEEASNINLIDVATSSPQVQKVINDIKALKDYPNNQLKQACVNLCSKL